VVVPDAILPEGAHVEIQLRPTPSPISGRPSPKELRSMSREQRQSILAAAAELAENDYRDDRELTGFDAFSEEEVDDDSEPS